MIGVGDVESLQALILFCGYTYDYMIYVCIVNLVHVVLKQGERLSCLACLLFWSTFWFFWTIEHWCFKGRC